MFEVRGQLHIFIPRNAFAAISANELKWRTQHEAVSPDSRSVTQRPCKKPVHSKLVPEGEHKQAQRPTKSNKDNCAKWFSPSNYNDQWQKHRKIKQRQPFPCNAQVYAGVHPLPKRHTSNVTEQNTVLALVHLYVSLRRNPPWPQKLRSTIGWSYWVTLCWVPMLKLSKNHQGYSPASWSSSQLVGWIFFKCLALPAKYTKKQISETGVNSFRALFEKKTSTTRTSV